MSAGGLLVAARPTPAPSPTGGPGLSPTVVPDLSAAVHHLALAGSGVLVLVVGLALLRLSPFGRAARPGMASAVELARHMSVWRVRWSTRQTRPGLTRRWRAPAGACGVSLGYSLAPRRPLWGTWEDSYLVVGPPRQGKDTWAGHSVIDAPGAVLLATTKAADIDAHVRLRGDRGPVIVFNPEGLGGVASSLRWSPVAGCEDPEVAITRAGYLLMGGQSMKGLKHAEFFQAAAAKVLRALLVAAAVSDRTLIDVYRWASDERGQEPVRLLERANDGRYNELIADLRSVQESAARATAGSVFQTLASELQFLASPTVAATVNVPPARGGFDVGEFVRSRGTLYLIGEAREESATVGPLLTALTAHIADQAKLLASHGPGGRLDPPILLVLNEVAKIVPIPLDRWFADHGSQGLTTVAMAQSYAQLVIRWGQDRARAIWDASTVKLLFGGSSDEDYLRSVSALCGTTRRSIPLAQGGSGRGQGRHVELVPVVAPDELRMLPKFRYLIIRSSVRPVVAATRKVWRRRDVRAARKRAAGLPELAANPTGTTLAASVAAGGGVERESEHV